MDIYGFVYAGLLKTTYFWEAFLHLMKIALIIISQFMHESDPLFRALLGFIIMFLYLELLVKVRPYITQTENSMDFAANFAGLFTYFVGLFLVSTKVNRKFGIALFSFMIIVNVYFLQYFFRHALKKQIFIFQ